MTVIIQGILTDVFPSEIFGNFEKRVAWVQETDVQYPNTFALEFHQGDANILDNFVPGDVVKCSVDLRGRKWSKNGKEGVMNTLKCWKMERLGQAKVPPSTRQQTGGIPPKNQPQQPQGGQPPVVGPDDDLPF